MTAYTSLIGTIKGETDTIYTCFMDNLPPKPYKVLIPQGTVDLRVNFYAAEEYKVAYVARAGGPPSMDYSGIFGISDSQWFSCGWKRDGKGDLTLALNQDWQVRLSSGHGFVITDYIPGGLEKPVWLYLLPVIAEGSIRCLEVKIQILKNKYTGWNPLDASDTVYPYGGKFYTGGQVDNPPEQNPQPTPNPIPWPPIPIPEPEDTPHVCPIVDVKVVDGAIRLSIPKWKMDDIEGGPNTIVLEENKWSVE